MKPLQRFHVPRAVILRCLAKVLVVAVIAAGAIHSIAQAADTQNPQASTLSETGIFSANAEALPFPRDAREIEFDATFKGIEFRSGSSLASLEAFFRRELRKRGWEEDDSAAKRDEESSDMTFTHDGAKVEIELDVYSSEVAVDIECEELDFGRSSDPAALVAAGVPQPRSYLFLQKEIPLPKEIHDTEYKDDACHFKSTLTLQPAFDFYGKAMKDSGWRESRRPIVTNDRRYTEFKKGPVTLSVNIFSHDVGSRIILGYKHEKPEPIVPPLDPVDSPLAKRNDKGTPVDAKADLPAKVPVDATRNTGSATVMLGATKYEFKHAAAYRTKSDGDDKTILLFSQRPIPLQQLQDLIAKNDDVTMSDVFKSRAPEHMTISYGNSASFHLNVGGTAISDGIRSPDDTLKVDGHRIHGEIKMPKPQEFFDESVQLSATIDAAIITRNTMLNTVRNRSTPK